VFQAHKYQKLAASVSVCDLASLGTGIVTLEGEFFDFVFVLRTRFGFTSVSGVTGVGDGTSFSDGSAFGRVDDGTSISTPGQFVAPTSTPASVCFDAIHSEFQRISKILSRFKQG
jgi:hypothetical protein